MIHTNDFGQPIGRALDDGWTGAQLPATGPLVGTHVTLEPLDPDEHAEALFQSVVGEPLTLWTYMPAGPFTSVANLCGAFEALLADPTSRPYAVVVDGTPTGWLEYLRIAALVGTIEIGWVLFPTTMQRSRASTEDSIPPHGIRRSGLAIGDSNGSVTTSTVLLALQHSVLAIPTKGTFRNATHYKGRSRDTAWYSITVEEWPALDRAFRSWLHDENFDSDQNQIRSLVECRESPTSA